MRRLTIASLALLGMVAPCLAQSPSQGPPDFGIDTSGVLRNLSVRDATLGSRVPLAILDTTTHSFVAPIIPVEAYGAISGDALDDKAAIQAALTAAPTGRCVSGSGKTYLVNGWLLLKNGNCLQDIKLVETATGAQRPITSNCTGGGPLWPSCEGPFTLRRVVIDRGLSSSSTDAAGIYLARAVKGLLLEDVEVTGGAAGAGIQMAYSQNVKLVRPWVHDMEWTNTDGSDPGIEQITGITCPQCVNVEIVNPRVENLWGTIPWVTGQNLAPSQGYPWRTNAGNAYRATTYGSVAPTTSGTTPPTCTGTPGVTTCSDGNKTWTYMGPAATTKRAYQADGTGFSAINHLTILGGFFSHTWEGIDIGASNDVWLYGVTFIDTDSWGEKWCHSDTNSGSVGTRVIRPGIAGVVICGPDAGPTYISHMRIIGAQVTDPGANGNWAGTHAGFWSADGTDIQFVNTSISDTQAIPTMTVGYRSDATTAPLGPTLINPYVSGGTARSGLYNSVLEGPYGTAIAANTGTTGHAVPFLDAVQNVWGSATQQVFLNTSAGAATIPVALRNGGGTAGTEVIIDLSPTNNAPGVRSAQIASVSPSGSSNANLVFRTSSGGTPGDRMTIDTLGGVTFGTATAPAAGNARAQGGFQVAVTTVGTLPACSAALEGMTRGVSDANSTTYNATAAAGGANHMPVYCNGTNWVLH